MHRADDGLQHLIRGRADVRARDAPDLICTCVSTTWARCARRYVAELGDDAHFQRRRRGDVRRIRDGGLFEPTVRNAAFPLQESSYAVTALRARRRARGADAVVRVDGAAMLSESALRRALSRAARAQPHPRRRRNGGSVGLA